MKTPVTKKTLQDHIAYAWWKYALLAVLGVFGWSILYSMTEYRPPESKKIILGVYAFADNTRIDAYMEQVRQELLPEMEDMSADILTPDNTYGAMILTTRFAARDCDLYLLPRNEFQNYARMSGFVAIEQALPQLVEDLQAAGISLDRGWQTAEATGEKHLYGIPCANLPGLAPLLQCDASDLFLTLFWKTGNDDNARIFFDRFVRDMMAAPAPAEAPAA